MQLLQEIQELKNQTKLQFKHCGSYFVCIPNKSHQLKINKGNSREKNNNFMHTGSLVEFEHHKR